MKRFALLLLCLASPALLADEAERFNVVAFNAEARAEVPNDRIEIVLSVEKEARRAAELAAEVNEAMNWALERARAASTVQAATRNYRTEPRYDKSGTIVAWRASQNLVLGATDIEAASALASELQERLLIKSMNFRPSDATRMAIEDQLTVQALARFRERAETIRGALKMEAYEIVEIQIGQQAPPPVPMYQSRMAMAAESMVAVEAGTSALVVSVHGRIQLR